jgi:hypothetical protein
MHTLFQLADFGIMAVKSSGQATFRLHTVVNLSAVIVQDRCRCGLLRPAYIRPVECFDGLLLSGSASRMSTTSLRASHAHVAVTEGPLQSINMASSMIMSASVQQE